MKKCIGILLLFFVGHTVFAQGMNYKIRGAYARSITKEKLIGVQTINSINAGYPSSWVNNYVSVEVSAISNGMLKKEFGKSDHFTAAQTTLLENADLGTDLEVKVRYDPKNTHQEADYKEVHFLLTIIPEKEAVFPKGDAALQLYVKEQIVDKLSKEWSEQLKQGSVRFTINEKGEVVSSFLSKKSGNEEIDTFLLDAIQKMENWTPAQNAKGEQVKQEFVLNIGNLDGC